MTVPKCPDILDPVPKCLTDTLALDPNCLDGLRPLATLAVHEAKLDQRDYLAADYLVSLPSVGQNEQ